jgi:hypothetical protein
MGDRQSGPQDSRDRADFNSSRPVAAGGPGISLIPRSRPARGEEVERRVDSPGVRESVGRAASRLGGSTDRSQLRRGRSNLADSGTTARIVLTPSEPTSITAQVSQESHVPRSRSGRFGWGWCRSRRHAQRGQGGQGAFDHPGSGAGERPEGARVVRRSGVIVGSSLLSKRKVGEWIAPLSLTSRFYPGDDLVPQ